MAAFGYAITVNGVPATNNGDGTWTANSVPIPQGNVSTMQAKATTSAGSSAQAQAAQVKGLSLKLESVSFTDEQSSMEEDGSLDYVVAWNWQPGQGGTYHVKSTHGGGGWESVDGQIDADGSLSTVESKNSSGADGIGTYFGGTPWASDFPQEVGYFRAQSPKTAIWWESHDAKAKWQLHAGNLDIYNVNPSLIKLTGTALQKVRGTNDNLNAGRIVDGTNMPGPEITNTGMQENTNHVAYVFMKDGTTMDSEITTTWPLARVSNGPEQYKLSHLTVHTAYANKNRARTTIGVGEEVDFGGMPDETVWSATAGSLAGTHFTAPSNEMSATVSANLPGFPPIDTDFTVKKPAGVDHADITSTHTNFFSIGDAGAEMDLGVYFAPTSVSFYRVQILEIGGDATGVTGYFADTNLYTMNPPHCHQHTPSGWIQLDPDNFMGDQAGILASYPLPSPWSSGAFQWDIPSKWKVGNDGSTNDFTSWTQTFSIDANGTVSVSKFDQTVTRYTNNVTVPAL